MDEVLRLEGVIDGDLLVIHDGVAEHPPLFLGGGGPVEAGGDKNGDLCLGVSLADLGQKDGEGNLAGHCPGMVAGHQGDPFFARGQLRKLFGADGIFQGLPDQGFLAFFSLVMVHFRSDHRFEVLLCHVEIQGAGVIGDGDGFHDNSLLRSLGVDNFTVYGVYTASANTNRILQ